MTPNTIHIQLAGHGLFIARLADVQRRMGQQTKRQMITAIAGIWPEMIARRDWTRKDLAALPGFVLAAILEQI